MTRPSRIQAARQLAADIRNGAPLPRSIHPAARLVMPVRLASARGPWCVICNAGLIGRQKTFCAAHWDYLAVPLEASLGADEFCVFLEEAFEQLRVVHIQRHWLAVINGHSRCDICDVLTSNVERLVTGDDRILKQHTVCPDHQTAR